jgi:hypothetical protein
LRYTQAGHPVSAPLNAPFGKRDVFGFGRLDYVADECNVMGENDDVPILRELG